MEHDLVSSLDVEGDLLRPQIGRMVAELRAAADGCRRCRVLDLGAGTGSATFELALRFGGCSVLAVDAAPTHLERLRAKALDLGLADRVDTVLADLDGEWPALEPVDVVWASMSLHHLRDPDRALRSLAGLMRPGGLLAVVEMGDPLWPFVDGVELGPPGIVARAHGAFLHAHAEEMPALGDAFAPRVEAAGFALLDDREVEVAIGPPYPPGLGPYVRQLVERVHAGAGHGLDATDQESLRSLADGDALDDLLGRGAVVLRGSRRFTLARRVVE